MSGHAELGASGASRWMNCPGAPAMSRGLPSQSSIHARVGTVAHYVGEVCLHEGLRTVDPDRFLGTCPDPDNPDIAVDEDMIEAVNVYLDHCFRLRDRNNGRFWIERKVSLAALATHPDHAAHGMFGTADFTLLDYSTGTLFVCDYKHGSGIPVQAQDNPQLWYYGLGALLALDRAEHSDTVVVTVVQPRDDGLTPVRSQIITTQMLIDWAEDELMPAAEKAYSLFGWDRDAIHEAGYLNPGSHCRFCPAAGICPALKEQRMEQAKMVFQQESGKIEPEKPVQELTTDELRTVLDSADDVIAWIKSAQKLAHEMLEQNTVKSDDLGYKLVQKRAQRKWADTEESVADKLCEEFGLGDDELFETKLRSVAQVEKEVGPAKAKKSSVWKALTKSESSGTTLAPASDKREAVKTTTAQQAFGAEDEDESLI